MNLIRMGGVIDVCLIVGFRCSAAHLFSLTMGTASRVIMNN